VFLRSVCRGQQPRLGGRQRPREGPEGRRRAVRDVPGRAGRQHRGHRAARRPRVLPDGHARRPEGHVGRPVRADHRAARARPADRDGGPRPPAQPAADQAGRAAGQQGAALPGAVGRGLRQRPAPRRGRLRAGEPPRPGTGRRAVQPAVRLAPARRPGTALRLAERRAHKTRGGPRRPRPVHAHPARAHRQGVPAPDHQHPPVAAAVLPRGRPVQAGVRQRRARPRLHGPLRHRATGRGAGHPAGRVPHRRRLRHARRREAQGPGPGGEGAQQGGQAVPRRGAGRRRGQGDLQARHLPVPGPGGGGRERGRGSGGV
ncbi:MAG: Formyltetrahydrofolate deformylase, partial [uncultured Phycisphaerae bacterium]